MPKKETKTLVITILLIDALSIGTFFALFSFAKNQIAESVKREGDIKMELKGEEIRSLMKEDLSLGKMYQEELIGYMIPSGGTVEFIKTIEQIVSNSKLKSDIKTVSGIPYDKGDTIGTELININMDVIGEWRNIQFFLKSLENYPLKIDVKKISLNKFSDYTVKGRTIPEWSGNLEFTVVKIKDKK